MSASGPQRARLMLSFHRAYVTVARRLAEDLRAASLEVVLDQWEGGDPGVRERRSVGRSLDATDGVVALLTPSDVTPRWIGDVWRVTIFDDARRRAVPVFVVRAADCEFPAFLRDLAFADIHRRGYRPQLRQFLRSIGTLIPHAAPTLPSDVSDADDDAPPDPSAPSTVTVRVGRELAVTPGGPADARFTTELAPMIQDGLFYELGVHVPAATSVTDPTLPPMGLQVVLNGVSEATVELPSGRVLVNDDHDGMARRGFDALPATNPANGTPGAWIPSTAAPAAEAGGCTTWDATALAMLVLSAVLRRKAADFLVVAEVRAMVAQLRPVFPLLVAETVPAVVSEFVLTDVLRRLVTERVSIRNLRRILMVLADWARHEHDPVFLTEYTRAGLRNQITHALARGSGGLIVLMLDPELEEEIRSATRHTATGSYLDLDAGRIDRIAEAIVAPLRSLGEGVQLPAILTVLEIRAIVQRLVALALPDAVVISYHEVATHAQVQPIGRVRLDRPTQLRNYTVLSHWHADRQ